MVDDTINFINMVHKLIVTTFIIIHWKKHIIKICAEFERITNVWFEIKQTR